MSKNLILLTMLVCSLKGWAQDVNFSQFYEMPMLRNPALAGSFLGDVRATAAGRSQWAAVTVPYVSEALGVELKFGTNQAYADYFTLGLQVTNDQAGDSKMGKTQMMPVLAFNKSISENTYVSAGFAGGMVQQKFDPTDLRFGDQYINGSYSPTNLTQQTFKATSKNYWDVGAGLVLSTQWDNVKLFAGASLSHINRPSISYFDKNVKLYQKWGGNFGITAPVSETGDVIFYTDYFKQGGHQLIQSGFMYRYNAEWYEDDYGKSFTFGALMRWGDAVIPVAKVDLYKFSIGLSYDANISKLSKASSLRGGTELTLGYRTFLNMRSSTLQQTRCPSVF